MSKSIKFCTFPNQPLRIQADIDGDNAHIGIPYLPRIDILSEAYSVLGIEMADVSELMQRYEHLIGTPSKEMRFNENGESVAILCQSDWVRILVIQYQDPADLVSIEVELSLPTRSIKVQSGESGSDASKEPPPDTRMLAEQVMEHLRYMTHLQDEGFTLDVIGQECLWTASKDFQEPPSRETFELLSPPSKCVPWNAESSVISPFRYVI